MLHSFSMQTGTIKRLSQFDVGHTAPVTGIHRSHGSLYTCLSDRTVKRNQGRGAERSSPLEGPSHQDCSSDKPRKRSRKTQRPSEGSSERDCFSEVPSKSSRKTLSPSEGPSHQDCSSDKPRKRSRKTQRPSEGSSKRDCFSKVPSKSSRKTLSPSEGPSHQDCSSDKPRKRSRKTQRPSQGSSKRDCFSEVPSKSSRKTLRVPATRPSPVTDRAPHHQQMLCPPTVAIKEILQSNVDRTPMLLGGNMIMVPLEVALLLRLKPAESETSAVVTLLDWYDLDNSLILVLERPVPCMTLQEYVNRRQFPMQEHETKIIIKQLVDSLIEIHSKEVFHRDIKTDNILIETGSDVPRVRIIDFGCGTFLSGQTYTDNEVILVVLLRCLAKDKEARPTLAMLKNHPWLM
ncbi:Serine/threonine-protein kinase pim-2 [Collichthys lucidus]|uniref:Serine/threonine-protein kinase 1 n=1 Tax=Collichthys lucidus TaxID=240159 RepID=A0A4U5UHX9_COLLU|nr:Serine/threonine-protein kinase pim-2 [Collichthys lucidus]